MESKEYLIDKVLPVFSNKKRKVEYFRHNVEQQDKAELMKVLDTVFLTTGTVTKQFEEDFARYLGAKYAVGVMSCTHALELCLRYFGIGEGDEVITTPLSYVATANTIEFVGAKPVFVDVEWKTANIDPTLIEVAITPRTKAIIPVHLYGQMCNMTAIKEIADRHGLIVIEDAAHCIEGEHQGRKSAALSNAACYSFYATKNITSGEGGAIATNDEEMYKWLVQGRSHGISSSAADRYTKKYRHYDMEFLGMKSNMTNMQAALLIHQVERIETLHQRREVLFNLYETLLSRFERPGLEIDARHAYHVYSVWVKNRDAAIDFLYDQGIGVAVHYRPTHLMAYYQHKYGYEKGDFPIAEYIGEHTLSLPLYPLLLEEEVEYVCETLQRLT
jgi:dTDP-4-amino-4,6-dideoxygalactose transaminase